MMPGRRPTATSAASQLDGVLDMLAGRYPSTSSQSFARGWCGIARQAMVRGRDGARRLAVTSGGTIPDRGLYGVFLRLDSGARVGELDEEMVYEGRARRGLPAGRDIVADRADHARPRGRFAGAGRAGADAVLEGRRPSGGRSELGRAVGEAGRGTRAGSGEDLDELAASNLTTLSRRPGGRDGRLSRPTARSSSSGSATRSATGACASSRRSAGASTPRGRWRSRSAWARPWGSRWSRCGPTTASRSACPTPTRRRRST